MKKTNNNIKMEKKTAQEIKLVSKRKKFKPVQIMAPWQAYEYIINLYDSTIDIYETAYILILKGDTVLGWYKLSQGGATTTVMDPKIITKIAIDSLAQGVIVAHNHPSGSCMPSVQDKKVAGKIKECLEIFNIEMLDFMVVAHTNYYSFKENQEL